MAIFWHNSKHNDPRKREEKETRSNREGFAITNNPPRQLLPPIRIPKAPAPDSFQSVRGRHSCEPNSWTSRNINKEPGLSGEQSRSRKLFHRVVPPLGRTRGADSSIILNRFPRTRHTKILQSIRGNNSYKFRMTTDSLLHHSGSDVPRCEPSSLDLWWNVRWVEETKLHLLVSLKIGSIDIRKFYK